MSSFFISDGDTIHFHALITCSIRSIHSFIATNQLFIQVSSYFFCSFNILSSSSCLIFLFSSSILVIIDSISLLDSSSEMGLSLIFTVFGVIPINVRLYTLSSRFSHEEIILIVVSLYIVDIKIFQKAFASSLYSVRETITTHRCAKKSLMKASSHQFRRISKSYCFHAFSLIQIRWKYILSNIGMN